MRSITAAVLLALGIVSGGAAVLTVDTHHHAVHKQHRVERLRADRNHWEDCARALSSHHPHACGG